MLDILLECPEKLFFWIFCFLIYMLIFNPNHLAKSLLTGAVSYMAECNKENYE